MLASLLVVALALPEPFDLDRLRREAHVLLGSSAPVAAPAPGSTTASQGLGDLVARDRGDFYITWTDTRSGQPELYGARVAADGTTLDPDGIFLARVSPHQLIVPPEAGSGAAGTMLTWRVVAGGLFVARVRDDGTIAEPIELHGLRAPSYSRIATNGRAFLITARDASDRNIVALLDAEGNVLRTALTSSVIHTIASNGETWALTGEYGNDIHATLLDDELRLIASHVVGHGFVTTIETDGRDYRVLWTNRERLSTAVLRADGAVEPQPALAIPFAPFHFFDPVLAWTGSDYLAALPVRRGSPCISCLTASDLFGVRVSPLGSVTSTFPMDTTPWANPGVHLARGAGGMLAAWTWSADERDFASSIRIGPVGGRSRFLTRAAKSMWGTGAIGAAGEIRVWSERSEDGPWLVRYRVGAREGVLSENGAHSPGVNEIGVSVAATDAGFAVAWQERGGAPRFATVGADGTAGQSIALPLPGGHDLDVGWDGTRHLVVASGTIGVLAVRVSAAGVLLDTQPIVLRAASDLRATAAVTAVGGRFAVVSMSAPRAIHTWILDGDGRVAAEHAQPVAEEAGWAAAAADGDRIRAAFSSGVEAVISGADARVLFLTDENIPGNAPVTLARIGASWVPSWRLARFRSLPWPAYVQLVAGPDGTAKLLYGQQVADAPYNGAILLVEREILPFVRRRAAR